MRIALDARTIYRPSRCGTAKNLIELYRHVAEVRPSWQVVGFHHTTGDLPTLLPRRLCKTKLIEQISNRLDAWGRWRLPLAAWQAGADLLHCPSNLCPAWMPLPTVVTVHDLTPLDFPQGRDPMQVHRFEQSIRGACARGAWIICPSHYIRNRLVNQFNADPQRITVNYCAPDSSVTLVPPARWPQTLRQYGVQHPFVLHLSTAEGHKNTRRLIHAWNEMHPSMRCNWQLLVIGLNRAYQTHVHQLLEQMNLTHSIILHDFVDEADLPTLLSAADVLAYPSLSEGFGLPILDAWKTHTAVLASDCTAIPEVAGNAALLVNPTSIEAITDGLTRLLESPLYRDKFVQRGRNRLGTFSWQKTAHTFVQTMEKATALAEPLTTKQITGMPCSIRNQ